MPDKIKLSELAHAIGETIQGEFAGQVYWVSAQITNVKRQQENRRCYLTLTEYEAGVKTADLRAVFWANYFNEIEKFEKATKQEFKDGIEIICKVMVRFHAVFGLQLNILEIDVAHAIGSLELEKQKTLERLLKDNPKLIQFFDGAYRTFNNRLPLPLVISRIALITAPNSDGQRDFIQESTKNVHGYNFTIVEFLTTIQGDNSHILILDQLKQIEKKKEQFDVVAIVRGGGSQTDFKPFDDYGLCRYVAAYPLPIFTGIGHDRNQSIVDLMAREQKTPTKVASLFVEHNFQFENRLIELKENFFDLVEEQIQNAKEELNHAKSIVKLSSPQAILNRGFAIVTVNNKIVVDPKSIKENDELQTILKNEIIYSNVTKKGRNEKRTDL